MEITLEMARNWYPDEDPVHDFGHVERVYHLACRIGKIEGADLEIVRAAALLHDAAGSDQRKKHHEVAASFALGVLERRDWPFERIQAVQHCIRAHRFRSREEQPQTIEAKVLFDADKLDAIGAVGVARAAAYVGRVGKPIFYPPSQTFLTTGKREENEPHSAYHEYLKKLVKIKDLLFTPTAMTIAEERHRFLCEFFERLAAEAGYAPTACI